MVDMYCVKCKDHKVMPEDKLSKVPFRKKGDIKAWKGECPTCGTGMYRIIGKKG